MNAGNLFRWLYRGQVFESRIESQCKACGRAAVVRLPRELLDVQPDHTTHVCHPAIGGCNHGFSDVSDSIGLALACAGYAATYEAWLAVRARMSAEFSEPLDGEELALFDAIDAFELAHPEVEDVRVEELAEHVEAVRVCEQCGGEGWLTGPVDAPFERAIPCYACGGAGR